MKRISLLFTLLIALVSSDLLAQTGNLTVFSPDGKPFYLILNGVRQNDNPETNIKVEALNQPYYKAKVIFEDQTLGEIEKNNLYIQDMDGKWGDVSYQITEKKGDYKLKFYSMTPMAQAPPAPPSTVVYQYNTQPKPPIASIQVTETTTTTTTSGGSTNSENVNVGVNMGGVDFGMNVNINDNWDDGHSSHSTTSYSSTTTTTTTTGGGHTHYEEPAPVANAYGCYGPMSSGDFSSAKSSISSKDWDDNRLTVAKQVAGSNCMTANQIKQIMQVMEWEDTRLEFAKYAYDRCWDKNNYYQVNDAFEWESSIDELNGHIGGGSNDGW